MIPIFFSFSLTYPTHQGNRSVVVAAIAGGWTVVFGLSEDKKHKEIEFSESMINTKVFVHGKLFSVIPINFF